MGFIIAENTVNYIFARLLFLSSFLILCLMIGSRAGAATLTVNVPGDANSATGGTFNMGTLQGDLRGCLNYHNFNPATDTIQFNIAANTITLLAPLPIIKPFSSTGTLAIDGANPGNSQVQILGTFGGFSVAQGTVDISNFTFSSAVTGGAGGTLGAAGGALGAGGAVFVDGSPSSANVTLSNISFLNCSATGGAGSAPSGLANTGGGGGGGMNGGTGGSITATNQSSGGCRRPSWRRLWTAYRRRVPIRPPIPQARRFSPSAASRDPEWKRPGFYRASMGGEAHPNPSNRHFSKNKKHSPPGWNMRIPLFRREKP